jgi:hypothetical protein
VTREQALIDLGLKTNTDWNKQKIQFELIWRFHVVAQPDNVARWDYKIDPLAGFRLVHFKGKPMGPKSKKRILGKPANRGLTEQGLLYYRGIRAAQLRKEREHYTHLLIVNRQVQYPRFFSPLMD